MKARLIIFAPAAILLCPSVNRPLPQAVLTCAAQAQNPQPNLTERAYQDREILYELQSPESHAFRITHDYTVRKVGERFYFNMVRAGSHVSDPESGAPAVRLWRIGTRRVLGISEQRFSLPEYRNLPEDLTKRLNGENEIFGDFLVCRLLAPSRARCS